jgi:hypothetical protein
MPRTIYRDIGERLLANSIEHEGHWLWLGATDKDGYGVLNVWRNGRRMQLKAHRASREHFVEPLPPEHDADHAKGCPRHCIHPNHITPMPWRQHRLKTGFPMASPPKAGRR